MEEKEEASTMMLHEGHSIQEEHASQSQSYCHHSPMLKTASYTSYRLVRASPSHFHHPSNINLTRTVALPASASSKSLHSSSSSSSSRRQSVQDTQQFKMNGNKADQPPKHQMVYFPGLMSEKRAFGDFRTVLHTGLYSQIVAMEVPVGGEIGDEVHTVDQILLFTSGAGLATIAGKNQEVTAGDVVVVPAGTQHQFVTRGDQPLELLTVYSPAEHAPGTVHATKEEGDKAEESGKDEAPGWSRRSTKENEEKGLVKLSGVYDEE